MIDGYDMVGVDGFGTLKGEVRYDQDVQKMANFFRFVHNDEELEVEFQTGIYLHTRKDINMFFLVSIDYDNKMFCWKWREEQTQLNFNNWIDIRIVTESEPSYKEIRKFGSDYKYIETSDRKESDDRIDIKKKMYDELFQCQFIEPNTNGWKKLNCKLNIVYKDGTAIDNLTVSRFQDGFMFFDEDNKEFKKYADIDSYIITQLNVVENNVEFNPIKRFEEVGGSMIDQVTTSKTINEMFNLSTKIKECASEGKGDVALIPYRNEVVFAVTDNGKIKVISYECNEPSFLGEDEINWNEDGEVTDEKMWNKIYKSHFFADFQGNPQDGDVDGGWSINFDTCKLILDLAALK